MILVAVLVSGPARHLDDKTVARFSLTMRITGSQHATATVKTHQAYTRQLPAFPAKPSCTKTWRHLQFLSEYLSAGMRVRS